MSVIFPDSRQSIPGLVPPWSAVVRVKAMPAVGPARYGTAWFIGPTRLVTAGHVLHHKGMLGGLAHAVELEFAGETLPAGEFYVHPEWTGSKDFTFDVGVIRLHGAPATAFSTLELGAMHPGDLGEQTVIAGYPVQPFEAAPRWAKGHVLRLHAGLLYHDIDTSSGQSGSPLIRKDGQAIGVHTRDDDATALSKMLGLNVAVPLTAELIQFLAG